MFHDTGFSTLLVKAGYFSNNAIGLIGLGVKLPPQFGQI
jgi:hypothetical protein